MTECSLQPTPLAMLGHRWRPVRGSALSELACGQGFDLRCAPRLRRGRRDEERPEQSATPAARRTKNVRQGQLINLLINHDYYSFRCKKQLEH